jgi:hypothetical protein
MELRRLTTLQTESCDVCGRDIVPGCGLALCDGFDRDGVFVVATMCDECLIAASPGRGSICGLPIEADLHLDDDENDCPECQRSHGPNYRGICPH